MSFLLSLELCIFRMSFQSFIEKFFNITFVFRILITIFYFFIIIIIIF